MKQKTLIYVFVLLLVVSVVATFFDTIILQNFEVVETDLAADESGE